MGEGEENRRCDSHQNRLVPDTWRSMEGWRISSMRLPTSVSAVEEGKRGRELIELLG